MATAADAAHGQPEGEAPSYNKQPIPSINKGSSIHTLGRGNLGNINAKYPLKKPPPLNQNSENISNGNTTTGTTKEEAISGGGSQSSENICSQESPKKDDDKVARFNAIRRKFGGGGKKQQGEDIVQQVAAPQATPTDKYAPHPDGDGEEDPTNPNDTTTEAPTKTSPGKKISSFLKSKSKQQSEMQPPPPPLAQPHHPTTDDDQQSPPSPAKHKNSKGGISKKLPFVKQQQQSSSKQSHLKKTSALPSIPLGPQSQHHKPLKPHNNAYPNAAGKGATRGSAASTTATTTTSFSKHHNMVQPKSHQRLLLERVAAQYFLNDVRTNDARYVGVTDYGYGDSYNNGGLLGNIDEKNVDYAGTNVSSGATPLGLSEERPNKDRDAIVSFLGGSSSGKTNAGDEDAINLSIITEATASTNCSKRSAATTATEQSTSTSIDEILEKASDHLSLGQNAQALSEYRRAMKCAFADVISVKSKLVEIKQRQLKEQGDEAGGDIDSTAADLSKNQERQFELTLLKVAARVADIHNNMGVVHEMNRHYDKARASYVDAMEVYHNTCKRFEESNDPDVDRTRRNVERMEKACASEGERGALHDEATRIAKRVASHERQLSSAQRKEMLNEAINTLQKALELEGETIGLTHPVSASTLIQIGKHHYEIREYDAAASTIRRAIEILRNALGNNHPQVGKNTLLLASIYERHGSHISPIGEKKDEMELELYVDALEPLKATLGEVHDEVGYLYVKIGYLYGEKGDVNLSLLAYKAGELSTI